MQGCTDAGELPGCTIIAGGSRFVVPEGGPTPAGVMATLKALPVLAFVEFRGDILNVFDSYAEMALGAVAEADPALDPYGATLRAMQGEWVSTTDDQARVRVEGSIWADVYADEEVARSVIWLGTGCSDGSAEGEPVMDLFTIGSLEAGSLCYTGVAVEGARMEATYAGRGNLLEFTRAK